MVISPYSNTKQQALAICGLIAGLAFITAGVHYSYSNIDRQQVRTQARKEYVKTRLRKLLDD